MEQLPMRSVVNLIFVIVVDGLGTVAESGRSGGKLNALTLISRKIIARFCLSDQYLNTSRFPHPKDINGS